MEIDFSEYFLPQDIGIGNYQQQRKRIMNWGHTITRCTIGKSHLASCKMGTGPFPWVKCSRGVLLTTHPLLVPRS